VRAAVEGRQVIVGSAALMRESGVDVARWLSKARD